MSLNDRQRRFVELIAQGKEQVEAYYEAGYKPRSKHSAESCATKLLSNAECQEYLAELRKDSRDEAVMNRYEILANLSEIGREKELYEGNTRIKAMETISKMEGYNEPDKVESSSEIRVIIGGDAN